MSVFSHRFANCETVANRSTGQSFRALIADRAWVRTLDISKNVTAFLGQTPPGQSYQTKVGLTEGHGPLGTELSRRAVLTRRSALCILASLATLPLAAYPSDAALVDEDVAISVFESVSPSVASIAVVRSVGGVPVREVVGSGVVWDAVGPHVLTNFHLVPPLQGTNAVSWFSPPIAA